jgi:hypothetical protein
MGFFGAVDGRVQRRIVVDLHHAEAQAEWWALVLMVGLVDAPDHVLGQVQGDEGFPPRAPHEVRVGVGGVSRHNLWTMFG